MKLIKASHNIANEKITITDYKFKNAPEYLLQLPFKLGVIGASNTGKTNAIVNYLHNGKYRDIFTNIVIVSPTASVDPTTNIQIEKKFNLLNPDAFYSSCDLQNFRQIVKDQQKRINIYNSHLEDLKLYKKFKQDPESLTDNECTYLYENFKFKRPTCIYDQFPTLLVVIDDCADDMKNPFLSKFIIKCRHLFISVILISQYYALIPSTIRNNLTALMLFKTHDRDVLDLLYNKAGYSADMDKETFYSMIGTLKNSYDFLFTNFNAPIDKKYRKNFNQIFSNFEKP